jgi:uncharacterized membrane protein YfcA
MLIAIIFFLATFVQSSVGFGLALVSMPLLVAIIGIQTASPLVAVASMIAEIAILLRYRESLNIRAFIPLTAAAIVAIPIGIFALSQINETVITTLLGILLISYSLYSLFRPNFPELAHPAWAYGFGFFAGLLGGAYNTSGPPVIVYGNSRRWPPEEFKCNLQAFFVVLGVIVIAVHALSGNLTSTVWQDLLFSLPGMALGLLAGFTLSERLNAELFGKIVLYLLIFLGLFLIIN